MGDTSELSKLRQEPKYEPTPFYTGPDTPEDGPALISLVNNAIDEILSMSQLRDRERVRERLKRVIDEVDLFATEDRDQTYRYVIRVWRAAGFPDESKLFEVPDDRVMASWEDYFAGRRPKP